MITTRSRKVLKDEMIRTRIVLVGMLGVLCLLGFALWRIQVVHGPKYETNLEKQSVRRVRTPGIRGRIFDRNGVVLADNRPSYCIAVYLEELRQAGPWAKTVDRVEELIAALSREVDIEPELDREEIRAHIKRRLPLPLLAWRDIGEDGLARFAERVSQLPGVDIYTEAMRVYPQNELLCHVLGYTGRADPPREEEPYHYYLAEMTGKVGVERYLNPILTGEAGGRLVRVDASGFKFNDIGERRPRAGSDVLLSIDANVQRVAQEALGDEPGAIVVLDPNNGDVLAMVSSPGFNPNDFVPFITSAQWKGMLENEDNPLMNRAAAGLYAPGSTFKPVVAMAALENNLATAGATFNCSGFFELGKAKFRCAHGIKHGPLNMREALKFSCNVYFYRLGLQTGHEYIYHMAEALGLGHKTGISLDYEAGGLLPNDGWKRRTYDDAWRPGDTCNLSIGQGALTVTPLQMAMVTAALANGGHVYRPRLVRGIRGAGEEVFQSVEPELVNEMNWSPSNIRTVRAGMRDVVMSDRGTGRSAAVPGFSIAGKTGTAEYGPRNKRKHRAWFISFAPYENPKYAIAVVLDDGISGGTSAGPKAKQVLSSLLGVTTPRDRGQG